MHPQTDAELTAWNEGVRIARTPSASLQRSVFDAGAAILSLSDAAARALDALGPDTFWHWADRGYYHALTQTH
jgi:hypothetical protein